MQCLFMCIIKTSVEQLEFKYVEGLLTLRLFNIKTGDANTAR